MKRLVALGVTFLSPLLVVAHSGDARACGGCFHPPLGGTMTATVVTGHRMAFATSPTRTVLWDQIKYSGNPEKFSWVLPVKGNVKLEASTDAWFEALDTVTNARVSAPYLQCFQQSGGGGCDCGSSADDVALAPASRTAGGGPLGPGGVIVAHEGSVGPYDYVDVQGSGMALVDWLPANGYVVPKDIEPVITAYATEGFRFLALKLAPGMVIGDPIKQMTPVRVITDGGAMTLPLRMVAAGTGDRTSITLYVIAEGRYEIDGAPQVTVDTSQLVWDWATSTSTYATAHDQALNSQGGRGWLTSFSELGAFTKTHNDALGTSIAYSASGGGAGGAGVGGPGFGVPTYSNLADLYFGQANVDDGHTDNCMGRNFTQKLDDSSLVYDDCTGQDMTVDGGTPIGDSGRPAADAGRTPPPNCPAGPAGAVPASSLICDTYSDIAAAMIGMHPKTVWITRLEANLPRESLASDLKIKPSDPQTEVSNTFRATKHKNPPCDLLENHPEVTMLRRRSQEAGLGVLSGLGLFFARRLKRRRRTDQTGS